MKKPFPVKVVIVLADGDVEQHHIMFDNHGLGVLCRNPSESPLKTAMILVFRDRGRYFPSINIVSESEVRFRPK